MAIRNIVKDGDEILTKVCRPVEKFDEKLGVLLDDMIETMKSADGVGSATGGHPPPRRGDRCGERPHRNGKSGDRGAERRAGMRRRVPVLPGAVWNYQAPDARPGARPEPRGQDL